MGDDTVKASRLKRCDGCGEPVGAAAMQTWDSMSGRAYCGKPECQQVWAESLPKREKGA